MQAAEESNLKKLEKFHASEQRGEIYLLQASPARVTEAAPAEQGSLLRPQVEADETHPRHPKEHDAAPPPEALEPDRAVRFEFETGRDQLLVDRCLAYRNLLAPLSMLRQRPHRYPQVFREDHAQLRPFHGGAQDELLPNRSRHAAEATQPQLDRFSLRRVGIHVEDGDLVAVQLGRPFQAAEPVDCSPNDNGERWRFPCCSASRGTGIRRLGGRRPICRPAPRKSGSAGPGSRRAARRSGRRRRR
jgi:hypothetical protein